MVNKKYIPKQGDICYIDFNSTKGHEQTGRRPAIVVSKDSFNRFTHMAFLCPITTNTKVFPTHYELKSTNKIKGMVLCEHMRSIDFDARDISYVECVQNGELAEIIDIIYSFIEI